MDGTSFESYEVRSDASAAAARRKFPLGGRRSSRSSLGALIGVRLVAVGALAAAVSSGVGGCAPPRKPLRPPAIDTATIDKATGKGDVYDVPRDIAANGQVTEGKAALSPTFQCCETNFVAKSPTQVNVANAIAGTPPVSTLTIALKVPVEFDCTRQGGAPDCVGTFAKVAVTRDPLLRPRAGGANQRPEKTHVYWNAAKGKCDGSSYKADLSVIYVAQYRTAGVPAVVAGAAEALEIDVLAPPQPAGGARKGQDFHGILEVEQMNVERPPTGKVRQDGGWAEKP